MRDYDSIAKKFGAANDADEDKYDRLAQQFGQAASTGLPVDAGSAAKPSLAGRVKALAAGANRGMFADLIGLPVDTFQNVLDLGRAGIGTVAAAAGRPDLSPDIPKRETVIGSSEWIARKLNDVGAGGMVNNPLPADKTSRVLHMGGRVAGGSITPTGKLTVAQQGMGAAKGMLGGLLAGEVGEISPEWAGLAGMAPMIASAVAPAAVRGAVRGGEAGRKAMVKRMEVLREGGIDNPSVGLASGNSLVSGLENLLSQTPGSMGLFERSRAANVAGMRGKTESIRDALSSEYGPVVAGESIQSALKGSFRDRINTTTRALNDRVGDAVGNGYYSYPQNSLNMSRRLSGIDPGAPSTSQRLQNPRIAGIADDLAGDVIGTPIVNNSLMNAPTRYRRVDGVVTDTPPGIPFGTLKNLRTSIGEEANSPTILGTPEGAQFKRLYGAMSQDMRESVGAADRTNAGVPVGPMLPSQQPGTTALNRANRYYSRASTRAEDLNGIANRDTPEGAYRAVAKSLESGPTVYERLRGAVTPEARQKVAATVVDELGRGKAGVQNADGDVWSPQVFLTNYNKLYRNDGGAALFTRLPGGETYAKNLQKIAKASEILGDGAKVWSNPSGTSQALVARGTIGTIAAGAVGGVLYAPLIAPAAIAAGSLVLGNQVSQRLLLNPKFVNWLANAPPVKTNEQAIAYGQRLLITSQMTNDPQFKQDASEYLQSLPRE